MAIPLIIGAAALASAAFGAKKGYDAKKNYSRANEIVNDAANEFETSRDIMNEQKGLTSDALKRLGEARLLAEGGQMKRFVEAVRQINQVSYRPIELGASSVDMQAPDFDTIANASYKAADLLKDGIGAVSSGVLTGIGASGLATQIGVASTGTAIGSLSGAAATNATLAWLGGGSLAAGGMGVAGGTAVLGGAIAGPVIAVMGYSAAKKSEKALTKAFEKEAELQEATQQVRNGTAVLVEISRRAREIHEVLDAVGERFETILANTERMLQSKRQQLGELTAQAEQRRAAYAVRSFFARLWDRIRGRRPDFSVPDPFDFNTFSDKEKQLYSTLTAFGYATYAMLKVKVLDDEGLVTEDSKAAVEAAQQLLEGAA